MGLGGIWRHERRTVHAVTFGRISHRFLVSYNTVPLAALIQVFGKSQARIYRVFNGVLGISFCMGQLVPTYKDRGARSGR